MGFVAGFVNRADAILDGVADYSGTVPGTVAVTVTAGHNLTTADYISITRSSP